MNKETLEALKKCIEKYERYVEIAKNIKLTINFQASESYGLIFGVQQCALCNLFYDLYCDGCPIAINTNQTHCGGTLYESIINAIGANVNSKKNKLIIKLLQAEVDFLKSLLPEEVLGGTHSPTKKS